MMRQILLLAILVFITSCGQKQVNNEKSTSLITDFEKPKGASFKVNDVELADSLLKIDSAKHVFENKIGKEILFFPEEHINYGLVNCPNNGLIQTIQECYDNHRPLVLTPDVIWLAICQGVSIHINEHYDSLKNVIFIVNKPDKIAIRNDSLEYSAKHWKSLIESFANETKKYTNDDFYSFFVSEFTTTTAIDKTAYQITLLESYKKAFDYIGDSGCGIPSILISGDKSDWMTILEKLDLLNKIGLSNWANNLKPIIAEFISASDGQQNKEFWQSMYKNASEYNAFYISGWIIKFFPYIKELEPNGFFDEKRGETKVGEIFRPNLFIDGDDYLLSTLSTDNFPSGIAKVPVTWNNYFKKTTKKLEVYAGFFAIKQYPDKSLEPFVSWAICEQNAKTTIHPLAKNSIQDLKHQPDYWSPHFAREVADSAIYDIKQFKTYENSLTFLKQLVIDSLKQNNMVYHGDTIEVVILSNGKIGDIFMFTANDSILKKEYVSRILHNLPEKWFPALAHPSAIFDELGDFSEEADKIKVRANSIFVLGL
jgi:hypothetical protein